MGIYGRDFAAVYNESWGGFTRRIWPFLREMVRRHNPGAGTWLDLCCGPGWLLGMACESGFSAVGVDLSPHQLKYARQNAPDAKLVRADVREFSLSGKFDVITCMFDSLNYLTRKRELERALRRARRHLAGGGLFIFDVNTFEGLRKNWCKVSTMREPERTVMVDSSFDEKRGLGRCLVTGFVREGRLWRRFEEEHVERGYRPEEIEELLGRAGLSFSKYDGDSLARARKRSGRLVYVCGED
jgi:SAM-dependent methyltransferase